MYMNQNEREKKVKIIFNNVPSNPVDRTANIFRYFLSMMLKNAVLIEGTNLDAKYPTCVDTVTGIKAEDGSHNGFIVSTRTNGNWYIKA